MNTEGLVALILGMSIATEKIVDLLKTFIPWLSHSHRSSFENRSRKIILQSLSCLSGGFISWLLQEQIQGMLPKMFSTPGIIGWSGYILFGLVVSGGSGFWYRILDITTTIQKTKKGEIITPDKPKKDDEDKDDK